MKIPRITEEQIKEIQELYKESMRIHPDDSYTDWLLSWDKDSIYDDDILYRDDLTEDEKKCSMIGEYELDITSRNPKYKEKYTYQDKNAFDLIYEVLDSERYAPIG